MLHFLGVLALAPYVIGGVVTIAVIGMIIIGCIGNK